MAKRDYYEILGVQKTSSKEEIKKAYKKLAVKHHPDKGGDPEKFKELSEAYAVLSDDTKRRTYDQFGHTGFDQRYSQEDIFRNANFEDIFRDVFGGSGFGGSIFDMFFGSGRRQRKGSDLRYDLEISFEEAAFGIQKKLKIPTLVSCKECNGTGAEHGNLKECDHCHGQGRIQRSVGFFTQVTDCRKCNGHGSIAETDCTYCHGDGVVKETRQITVNIPGGIESGNRLRVPGAGEAIAHGEEGDLYVMVYVQPHKYFERNGADVHLTFPISFSKAALGGTLEVPTLEKSITIKIPPGTQNNTIFRLREKGTFQVHSRARGDQLVRIFVKTPTKLTKKQTELFEMLAKESKENFIPEKGFFEKVKDVFM